MDDGLRDVVTGLVDRAAPWHTQEVAPGVMSRVRIAFVCCDLAQDVTFLAERPDAVDAVTAAIVDVAWERSRVTAHGWQRRQFATGTMVDAIAAALDTAPVRRG